MIKTRYLIIGLGALLMAPIIIISTKKSAKPDLVTKQPDQVVKLADAAEQQKTVTNKTFTGKTVTLNNNIEHKMLGYKKFGTHYPSNFSITIDGKKIIQAGSKEIEKKEDTVTVPVANGTITLRYDYEFGTYKTGANIVEFKTDPKKTTYDLEFSWKDDNRIIIEGTEVVSKTAVEV